MAAVDIQYVRYVVIFRCSNDGIAGQQSSENEEKVREMDCHSENLLSIKKALERRKIVKF